MNRLVAELASLVKGTVEGDDTLVVSGVNALEAAGPGELSFYGNKKYRAAYESTRAAVVLVDRGASARPGVTLIRVGNPHLCFAHIAAVFHPPKTFVAGRSPRAYIEASATVDDSATIMAGAYLGPHSTVGAQAVVFPGAFVGEHAQVGAHSILYNNATVAERCLVGQRCVVHSGAVIGADGFGFAFDDVNIEHVKIAQAGIVRLEDDVEVGANACIDRATIGETVIGRGTKIDNLVQVAHNCVIGPHSIICAQAGLSGSSQLGQGVVMGGQSGTAGHLHIGDLTQVGAQAGVLSDLPPQQTVMGSPAFAVTAFYKAQSLFQRLPEFFRSLRALEKKVTTIEVALSEREKS